MIVLTPPPHATGSRITGAWAHDLLYNDKRWRSVTLSNGYGFIAQSSYAVWESRSIDLLLVRMSVAVFPHVSGRTPRKKSLKQHGRNNAYWYATRKSEHEHRRSGYNATGSVKRPVTIAQLLAYFV